jgi:hypothetical protein
MDLGIKGKRALVCASSKGLGRGCAEALAEAGVDLVLNARGAEALEATAQHIRDTYGVSVTAVAADITTDEGRAAVLSAAGDIDILVTNAGGPPPGSLVRLGARGFHQGARRQHADAHRPDDRAYAQDDRPGLGPGGQHHLAIGEGADPGAGPVERGANGSDGLRCGHCAAGRAFRCDRQQPLAGRPTPPTGSRRSSKCRQGPDTCRWRGAPRSRLGNPRPPLRHDRGIRRDVRVPVFASTRASWSGRTSCSTAARSTRRSEAEAGRDGGQRPGNAFSLKDHLFNEPTLGQLAAEYAAGLPGFPAGRSSTGCFRVWPSATLLERIDWIADCLEPHLASDFPTMADQVEAAMPPPLDPTLRDDDFGQFIHAIPGVLAVRHGMSAAHLPRALDLLEAATQRFSMEFYIRPFLNAFPGRSWRGSTTGRGTRTTTSGVWSAKARAPRCHGRSGSRPIPCRCCRFSMRYTPIRRASSRDLSPITSTTSPRLAPDQVLDRLADWKATGSRNPAELVWMTKHALRTLSKQGHPDAMAALGYDARRAGRVSQFDVDPDESAHR